MTRKEQQRMMRLEAENRELRESLDKHMEIARKNLYEIVDMKIRLEMIGYALNGEPI